MFKIKRVKGAGVALAVAALVASAGCGAESPDDTSSAGSANAASATVDKASIPPDCRGSKPYKLKVNASVTGFIYLPFYVAQASGLFKQFNIDAEYQLLAGGAIPSLLAGQSDIAMTASSRVYGLRNEGRDVKTFGMGLSSNPSPIVVAKSAIDAKGVTKDSSFEEKVQALKGLKIATTSPGGGADVILRAILKAGGLDPKEDVKILYLQTGPAVVAAFSRGNVDATAFGPPTSTEEVMKHDGVEFIKLSRGDYPKWRGLSYVSFTAMTNWLGENEAAAGCFLAAMQQADNLIAKDPDKAEELGKSFIKGMDDDLYHQAFVDSAGSWTVDVCPDLKTLVDYDFENENGHVENPVEDHFNTDICQEYVEKYR